MRARTTAARWTSGPVAPRSAPTGAPGRRPRAGAPSHPHLTGPARPATTALGPADPLALSANAGLSEEEARQRLLAEGPNELPRRRRRGVLAVAREILSEPVVALLLGAAVLYLLFGERSDAVVILLSVGVVIGLGVYQETRAERALEALRELAAPSVQVLRQGHRRTIPAREVVRGDWVALSEGGRVPADGEVRLEAGLLVDESLLTGESVAVAKTTGSGTNPWQRPGGPGLPFVYAQTLVVRGQALVEVRATGPRTEAGRIASALGGVEVETPLIRQQVRPLVFGVGIVAVVLTAVLAVIIGLRSGSWVLGLLAGAALAIGLLPEEIPMVTTIYSVLGARRMARHRALARRFGTLPTLGCLTVLCSDKTGTLTMNRMRLSAVAVRPEGPTQVLEEGAPASADVLALVRSAALAGEPDPVDPMELAIGDGARRLGALGAPPPALLEHVPLSAREAVMRNVRAATPDGGHFVVAKGAPETLLDLCGTGAETRAAWDRQILALAREGYRTLGVAHSRPFPSGERTDPKAVPLEFLGLLGISDPLRPGVAESVGRCADAGLRVVMITGDHPETARAIARQAGFVRPDGCLTGADLEGLPDEELAARVRGVDVYARVRPEQKLRLVEMLKEDGEIVAMTGDGVNDAPALRAAHVGIAMGQRGTDVAREAASLVLLDDAFPTIVEAIRTGRGVFDNMRKALYYLMAVHVALAGMALLPVVFGFPILLFPVEIVFFELIVDPVSSLVFEAEPEEPDVMRRPPRVPDEPILARRALVGSILLGGSLLGAALAIYAVALLSGTPAAQSRALGFATLMIGNVAMVLVCRSSRRSVLRSFSAPNPLAWAVVVFGIVLLGLAVYFPPLAAVFQFLPPPPVDLVVAAAAAVACVVANDIGKRRWLGSTTAHLPSREPRAG